MTNNQKINPKLNIPAVICSNFVCLYDRFTVEGYNEHDTIESAIHQLLYSEDEGLCMPIAVINTKERKMVWFHDFLGEEVCEARVNSFLQNNCI